MNSLLRTIVLLFVFAGTALAVAPTIANPRGTPTGATTATLSVQITSSSDSAPTVFFDYGTTTGYGTTVQAEASPNTNAEAIQVTLTGLTTGATYHFRVRVTTVEGESAQTGDQTFVQSGAVTLTAVGHNATTGVVTLNGVVVPNGVAGTLAFEYGEADAFDLTATPVPAAVAGSETSVPVTAALPDGLNGVPIFNYRLVFKPTSGSPARIVSVVGKTNTAPKAVADSETLKDAEPVTLTVLGNDTDAESDVLKITAVTQGRFGAVTFTDTAVTYTPAQALPTADTFRYTIVDGFTGTASVSVTIRPLSAVLAGTHGGLIFDAAGRAIGYFRLTATALGSFTGVVKIDGTSYLLAGIFAADGSFHGAASRDGTIMPVDLVTVLGENGTTIRAEFAQGKYSSQVEFTDDEAATRGPLAGRYTVELPGGTETSGSVGEDGVDTTASLSALPAGTGWAALKVLSDGSVRVKGRLPDGRTISTRGALVVGPNGPQITFFDDPRGTRVVGSFDVGDTVTGSLRVDRGRSDDEAFPDGYDTTVSVNGARYIPPDDGGGVVSFNGGGVDDFTISFSGGGLPGTLTRNVRLTDAGQFKVLDGGREDLKMKVEQSSGRFTTKVTVDDDGRRVKGTGVFIQATDDAGTGGGAGVFKGADRPGRIQISAGSTPAPTTPIPTPRPSPTPTPIPTPTPTPTPAP